ncbi:MAG: hypothetical protein ACRD0U_05300, partial [Acidimicrobiales bacterium]
LVQDALPPPLSTAGLAELAIGTFECVGGSETAPPSTAPPPRTEPPVAPFEPAQDAQDALPATRPTFFPPPLPALTPSLGQPAALPGPVAAPEGPVRIVPAATRTVGFAYPVVLVLPLLLAGIGGYLARSLTGEVRLPVR